jgi:hypothetical protein
MVRQELVAFRNIQQSTWSAERIKRLQADGHTLFKIGRILSGPAAAKSAMEPLTAWWQHAIADDVTVWVRDGASPWRTKQIRAVTGAVVPTALHTWPNPARSGWSKCTLAERVWGSLTDYFYAVGSRA